MDPGSQEQDKDALHLPPYGTAGLPRRVPPPKASAMDVVMLPTLAYVVPVLHWMWLDSWWIWALTLPVVLACPMLYILYRGAEAGPGRH